QYMSRRECTVCHGARLRPEILGVTVRSQCSGVSVKRPVEEAELAGNDIFSSIGKDAQSEIHTSSQALHKSATTTADGAELNIRELCQLTISKAKNFVENLVLTDQQRFIVSEVTREILARLGFLVEVGLGYLNLD